MSEWLDRAKNELELAGYFKTNAEGGIYGGVLGRTVIELLELWHKQGHTGLSAPLTYNTFVRLVKQIPLVALTGADDEWCADNGFAYLRNKRCPQVVKDIATGVAYDCEAIVFQRSDGGAYTSKDSKQPITFPYIVPDKPEIIKEATMIPRLPQEAYAMDGGPIPPFDYPGLLFDYEKHARATAVYPHQGTLFGLMYTALGLAGEAGEVADQVKKIMRDDNGELTTERLDKITKELGDTMWYIANMCWELNALRKDGADVCMAHAARQNIKKLQDRKKRGVLCGDGGTR